MQKLRWNILVLLALLPVSVAGADVLVLQEGDSISGQLVRISDGVLVFRTKLKGQMMAPMDTVKRLTTDSPLMIDMRDPDADVYGRLTHVEGAPYLAPLAGGDPVPIDLTRIAAATPIPASASSTAEAENATEMSVQTGVMSRIGTQDYTDLYIRIGLEAEKPRASIHMDNLLERADSGEFPRFFRSETTFTGKGDSPWQPTAQVGLERDTASALDLRTDLTLGVNYRFDAPSDSELSALVGLNYAHEAWETDKAEWGRGTTRKDGSLNLKLGLRYQKPLTDKAEINGDIAVFPSLSDVGVFRARSSANLQKNLTDKLHLRLDLMLDYNSNPAFAGIDPWAAGVGAGIGWQF